MSASLVGSEMCIRDRPPPGARRRRFLGGPGSPPGEEGEEGSSGSAASACLLYTSDAADDM
eukprot:14070383-Alexandrium_andersonii.AAC.1